jgi:hypothetical protein
MSALARRHNSASELIRPSRSEQRAIDQIEGTGRLDRAIDVEAARRVGNRIDLVAATTVHTMERATDVIQARRDLAAGDPDIELQLMPFQQAGFRRMARLQSNLFGDFEV